MYLLTASEVLRELATTGARQGSDPPPDMPGTCSDMIREFRGLWLRVQSAGDQVNKIRESLELMVSNSTAYGLRQPHLERTRLCELADSELDPGYVRQRDGLKRLVRQLARPKMVEGKVPSCPPLCNASSRPPAHLRAQSPTACGYTVPADTRSMPPECASAGLCT
jgi:hypothetical protein